MIWIVDELFEDDKQSKTAGNKARNDITRILCENFYAQKIEIKLSRIHKGNQSIVGKIRSHSKIYKKWEEVFRSVQNGDLLIIQFPIISHSIFFSKLIKRLKRQGVKVLALVHDLDFLRYANVKRIAFKTKLRIRYEELSILDQFDKVIIHNDHMKSFLVQSCDFDKSRLISLEIFDYLSDKVQDSVLAREYKSCIVAGNLSSEKAGYIYDLKGSIKYNLYGVNFESEKVKNENIFYHGSFTPEILPTVLEGGFGVVWDGPSCKTCCGPGGEYLKFNNPHKTSLYISSNIPVVIWEKSALADFVVQNNIGYAIDSLTDLDKLFKKLTQNKYDELRKNTKIVSERMHKGFYTINAMNKAIEDIYER